MTVLVLTFLIPLSSCASSDQASTLDIPSLDAVKPDYDVPDLINNPTTKGDYLHNMIRYKENMEKWQDYSDQLQDYIDKVDNIIGRASKAKPKFKPYDVDRLRRLLYPICGFIPDPPTFVSISVSAYPS